MNDHADTLEEHFLENPPRSTREAQDDIQRLTGVRRGLTQVHEILKNARAALAERGTVPAKANPDEQVGFLKDELQPRLDEAMQSSRTVLFVDVAHFVYGPLLGYLWCLVRLFVPGPSGRRRYNVLAALNAVSHEVIQVSNHSYINALSVCELLREVAARQMGRVTLVMDNARCRRCELVKQEAKRLNIELLFLPSYSPNLNLIERLWKFVKNEVLAARPCDSYEAFTTVIDECLDQLSTKHKSKMDSLLTLNFQLFDDVPVLSE